MIDIYLTQYQPLQLRINRGKQVNTNFAAMNFGESKKV